MHNFDLLYQHGIAILSGEADKYGLRVLCDVNYRAAKDSAA